MNMYIILIHVVLCSHFISLTAQVQQKGVVEADISDSSIFPISNNRTANEELNAILDSFNVISFTLSYPDSEHPILQNRVEIICYCNDMKLYQYLKDHAGHLLSNIRYFDDRPAYNPNDNMWQLTLQNPDDWLWHLMNIEADLAWDLTKSSNDVSIAILDSDFDITHPDLENQMDHVDPYTGNTHHATGSSHGTRVSSCAGAETDGGGQLASVGFNTRLIGYDKQGNPLQEAEHASFTMGVDVISYSYVGDIGYDQGDSIMVKNILDNGTIIIQSAGNNQSNHDDDMRPFAHQYDERVIIVTSTDLNDNHTHPTGGTTHANFPEVDISAPGYGIIHAIPLIDKRGDPVGYPYATNSGTSLAAPIVAGVCALMKSVNPCLTPAQAQTVLKNTADPVQDAHLYPNGVGAGRVNALQAVLGAIDEGTVLTENMYYGWGNYEVEAPSKIEAQNIEVSSNADLTYRTLREVNFDGDFEVQHGGEFEVIFERICD